MGDLGERLPFAKIADPQGDDEDDHHGADEGGEVAVDAVQSDLGEDGGQRGEEGGEQCVKEPGHIGALSCVLPLWRLPLPKYGVAVAAWPCRTKRTACGSAALSFGKVELPGKVGNQNSVAGN